MSIHDWFMSLQIGEIYRKPKNVTWHQIEYSLSKDCGQYPHLKHGRLHKLSNDNFTLACKCCGQSKFN